MEKTKQTEKRNNSSCRTRVKDIPCSFQNITRLQEQRQGEREGGREGGREGEREGGKASNKNTLEAGERGRERGEKEREHEFTVAKVKSEVRKTRMQKPSLSKHI